MDEVIEEASKKYQGLVPLVYDIETMGLDEARPQDMPYAVYLKREADKVIAEKDAEIAGLKAAAKEPSVPNRTCRKCGSAGTLMYMPIVKDGRTYWDLYNNKGMDYVVGIRCTHCGEVAFVTKQTHEYELRKQKYKRCLDKAKWCFTKSNYHFVLARHGENGKENNRRSILYAKWHKRWLEIAAKLKEAGND